MTQRDCRRPHIALQRAAEPEPNRVQIAKANTPPPPTQAVQAAYPCAFLSVLIHSINSLFLTLTNFHFCRKWNFFSLL